MSVHYNNTWPVNEGTSYNCIIVDTKADLRKPVQAV